MAAQRRMQMTGLPHGAHLARGNLATSSAPFYQTPAYQTHIEQLGKLTRFLFPLPCLS